MLDLVPSQPLFCRIVEKPRPVTGLLLTTMAMSEANCMQTSSACVCHAKVLVLLFFFLMCAVEKDE